MEGLGRILRLRIQPALGAPYIVGRQALLDARAIDPYALGETSFPNVRLLNRLRCEEQFRFRE